LGTWSKNYWTDRKKVWVFLTYLLRQWQFYSSHMFCRRKKCFSVKLRFCRNTNVGQYWLLVPFISCEWVISMQLSGCYAHDHVQNVTGFVTKYPKIK
jgi:hypothetical protein